MLACVNVDRLLAVTMPLVRNKFEKNSRKKFIKIQKYFQFGTHYSMGLVSVAYSLSFSLSIGGLYISYTAPTIAQYSKMCALGWALNQHELYSAIYYWFRSLGGIASVVLFGIVWVVFKKSQNTVKPGGVNGHQVRSMLSWEIEILICSRLATLTKFNGKLQLQLVLVVCVRCYFTLYQVLLWITCRVRRICEWFASLFVWKTWKNWENLPGLITFRGWYPFRTWMQLQTFLYSQFVIVKCVKASSICSKTKKCRWQIIIIQQLCDENTFYLLRWRF